jgi:hypothetical protein
MAYPMDTSERSLDSTTETTTEGQVDLEKAIGTETPTENFQQPYPQQPLYEPTGSNAPVLSRQNDSGKLLVTFDGPDDPSNPLNWTLQKKMVNTILCALTTMGTTWASSMYVVLFSKTEGSCTHMGQFLYRCNSCVPKIPYRA